VDDSWLCLCLLGAQHLKREVGTEKVLAENWDGEAPILELVENILARKDTHLGEKSELVLGYTGFDNVLQVTEDWG
jgi:hypothetical protein